jgi:NitT/TauT family transport system substrate-binding protein
MQSTQSRRRFLSTISSAGAASLVRARCSFAQEAPPETTAIRLSKISSICIAPQYVADELLRAEGFTDIQFVATEAGKPAAQSLGRGEIDFTTNFSPPPHHSDRCGGNDAGTGHPA